MWVVKYINSKLVKVLNKQSERAAVQTFWDVYNKILGRFRYPKEYKKRESLHFGILFVILVKSKCTFAYLLIIKFFIVSILDVAGIRFDDQADFRICFICSNLIHLVDLFWLLLSIIIFSGAVLWWVWLWGAFNVFLSEKP